MHEDFDPFDPSEFDDLTYEFEPDAASETEADHIIQLMNQGVFCLHGNPSWLCQMDSTCRYGEEDTARAIAQGMLCQHEELPSACPECNS